MMDERKSYTYNHLKKKKVEKYMNTKAKYIARNEYRMIIDNIKIIWKEKNINILVKKIDKIKKEALEIHISFLISRKMTSTFS